MSLIVVAHSELSLEALRALIEDFVTRRGAIQGEEVALETRVAQVRGQLESGEVVIVFDDQEESCNLVTRHELARLQQSAEGRRIVPE